VTILRIPEWVDKWIVFTLVLASGVDDLARSTGLPGSPILYVLVPLTMAGLGLLAFLIWRALCRLAARTFAVNPSAQRVRLISNAIFFIALALVFLQPLFYPGLIHETVTLDLPRKISVR